MSRTTRPEPTEYAPFHGAYIGLVPEGDIVDTLRRQVGDTTALLLAQPESAGGRRYADGKWSLREVIGHVSDCERIFAYRALRFARGDATPLPGFDENAFVAEGSADSRTMASLCAEWSAVRSATVALLDSLADVEWGRSGTANQALVSVRAVAWICAGHELHHRGVLKARYL